jgi:hypothetical protein
MKSGLPLPINGVLAPPATKTRLRDISYTCWREALSPALFVVTGQDDARGWGRNLHRGGDGADKKGARQNTTPAVAGGKQQGGAGGWGRRGDPAVPSQETQERFQRKQTILGTEQNRDVVLNDLSDHYQGVAVLGPSCTCTFQGRNACRRCHPPLSPQPSPRSAMPSLNE